MGASTIIRLLFAVAFFIVSLAADDAFAEKTLTIRIGDAKRCEKLTLSGPPSNGGYTFDRIWVQREGIVKHYFDEERGLICFEPQRTGSTKIKISGEVQEYDRYGRVKNSRRFYRNFNVRVRPQKTDYGRRASY